MSAYDDHDGLDGLSGVILGERIVIISDGGMIAAFPPAMLNHRDHTVAAEVLEYDVQIEHVHRGADGRMNFTGESPSRFWRAFT